MDENIKIIFSKGLLSLFNGIATFDGYLMPKTCIRSSDTISPIAGDKQVLFFPKIISPKVNIIE